MSLDTLWSHSKSLLNQLYLDEENKDSLLAAHLASLDIPAPSLPVPAEWVNSRPLSLEQDLRGSYVLLDFFTYCCINCMHILPTLHSLGKEVPDGLVIIGVHSGKFQNEKSAANIESAVSRYNITHPVVNDAEYAAWNSYSIVCWPTLVLLDPLGKVALLSIGESDVDRVVRFVKDCIRVSPPTLLTDSPSKKPEKKNDGKLLRFPGKVFYNSVDNTYFISNSSNNNVIQTNSLGEVTNSFPDPKKAADTLESPQGLLVYEGRLVVCDTNKHRVVQFDIDSGEMSVLCGTGLRGHDLVGGGLGASQEISSPWDVELVTMERVAESCRGDLLLIAMAGTHQIWGHALTDVVMSYRGKETLHAAGITWCLAGSGDEANRNNSYPHKASFAQPSGLSWDGAKCVYVADSESSSVRMVEIPSFAVRNLVGGGLDPCDLFAFGDVDGKGTGAKLQHPIGVVCGENGVIYVADSYNHKLKVVNSAKRVITSLPLAGLCELSGLSYDKYSGNLLIADTNNHAIKSVHVRDHAEGKDLESSEVEVKKKTRFHKTTPASYLHFQETLDSIKLEVNFNRKLNLDGDSKLKVFHEGKLHTEVAFEGSTVDIGIPNPSVRSLDLWIVLYTCSDEGSCFMDTFLHRVNLIHGPGQSGDSVAYIQLPI